jgi:hypothetical protein
MNEVIERVKNFLTTRKRAYQFVFEDENVNVEMVLKDLAEFCRANESTFNPDQRLHAVLEGRREVWLRIQQYLQLPPDELWELYRKE